MSCDLDWCDPTFNTAVTSLPFKERCLLCILLCQNSRKSKVTVYDTLKLCRYCSSEIFLKCIFLMNHSVVTKSSNIVPQLLSTHAGIKAVNKWCIQTQWHHFHRFFRPKQKRNFGVLHIFGPKWKRKWLKIFLIKTYALK